jgi:hypothetical protein
VDWGIYLLVAVLSTGLGYAGGLAALTRDRRRRDEGPVATPPDAAFRLEHVEGLTWSLVNVGQATGALVSVLPLDDGLEHWPPQPSPDQVQTATSKLLPTLAPGASVSVWLSHHDPDQRLIVSWTSESNVRMGPVTLTVPPPG